MSQLLVLLFLQQQGQMFVDVKLLAVTFVNATVTTRITLCRCLAERLSQLIVLMLLLQQGLLFVDV